ncbi:hypothetical protein N752_28305 [Desulforamulus aquiferis]|nr:hypothetical protein N752_28305 [Desulforamulus aquiferis]
MTNISLSEGQQVELGEVIGEVAEQSVGEAILHFEVRENDKLIDPLKKINLSTVTVDDAKPLEAGGSSDIKISPGGDEQGGKGQ